ncbi:gp16 family protein [uncultured Tateyamaria sp.]|uniref:gp16 family protein n=1 Tax=uncultured Tateyamaria sp. TaxID=455651 RepID=UPI0026287286|nr:regulatory protein GemA [uncultured Tateyamaria sp.]
MSRDPQLAQIHIAKKQLGLDDDTYRDVVERVTGQRSAKGLTDKSKRALIGEFKRMGWKGGSYRRKSDKPYVRKVFALWSQLKRDGIWQNTDVSSLRAFVKKMTGVADPEWLSFNQATVVIEALKKIGERGNG